MAKNKYFIAIAFLTMASFACTPSRTLNLATYNVGAFHKSGFDSTDMIADMMKEWNLDAIGLNELDSCNTRCGVDTFQLRNFAEAMGGWNYNFTGAIRYRGGSYGIGIASPHTPVNVWSIKLPKSDDREVRALSVMEFDDFVFCSTHLGLKDQAQLDQIAVINTFVKEHFYKCRKPVFLCGDMNSEPGMVAIETLGKDWEMLSPDEITFETSNPCKCIDYIFLYRRAGSCKVKASFSRPPTIFRSS